MRKSLFIASVLACLIVLLQNFVASQAQAATTIGFEVGQTGNSGNISGDFKSLGVIFTRVTAFDVAPPPPGTGTATASNLTFYRDNTQGFANQSPEYSVAVGGGRDGSTRYGTIRADFFDPDTATPGLINGGVSVWLGDTSAETDNVSLQAFNSTGVLLAGDTGQVNNGGQNILAFDILSVSASQIAYVLISADHPVSMDDFTFDKPVSASSVPEPTCVLLLGVGLIGLAGARGKVRA